MLCPSMDSFNDDELSSMATQIVNDLQSKEPLDSHQDLELTNLAMEIMKDLNDKPNFDGFDSEPEISLSGSNSIGAPLQCLNTDSTDYTIDATTIDKAYPKL